MLQCAMFPPRLLTALVAVAVAVQYAYVFRATVEGVHPGLTRLDCWISGKGGKPPRSGRDCATGQGRECTQRQPCTPCDEDGGCIRCERGRVAAVTGECGFVEGVGPYCRFAARNGTVAPCVKCCSG
jgi:hypothetical protein